MATKKSEETKVEQQDLEMIDDMAIATDLLLSAKAGVRNLAIPLC